MSYDSAEYLPGYQAAQNCARELVTLALLDELPRAEEMVARLAELDATPFAKSALVEILVGAVAEQWADLEDFSTHVVAALGGDDTEGGWT